MPWWLCQAYSECNSEVPPITVVWKEEATALALGTGGNYYPSSYLTFSCYPPDYENILQALVDISNTAG